MLHLDDLLGSLFFSVAPGRNSEPRRVASLASLLDDQHWHHLAVERRGSHLNLTVDKHTERVVIPAEFSHWDVEQVEEPIRELPKIRAVSLIRSINYTLKQHVEKITQ